MIRAALLLALLLGLTRGVGQADPYELRFCVPPNAWPAAERDRGGYDLEIAEILAEELGAEAAFEWTPFDDRGIRDTLHSGLCDAAMGVAEGAGETLSTVVYLRTPYVFVTRSDRDLEIASLDDALLHELTIGTYQTGIPTIALQARGHDENLVEYAADVTPLGVDPHTPIVDAVIDGEVDVGVVYGPVAGIRQVEGAPIRLAQVTPEIDFGETIIQHSRIWVIGVRPHDEALRDRLNRALSSRWDDVLAVLDRYGVPQLDATRPRASEPPSPDTLRVGVLHPSATPAQIEAYQVGEAGRRGVASAENAASRIDGLLDRVRLYESSAPIPDAAARAAHGLIVADGVHALVGGYTPESAARLAAIAREAGILFVNVGSERAALRDPSCYPTSMHVAPGVAGYLRGIVATETSAGATTFFAVAEEGRVEDGAVDALRAAAEAHGATLSASATVAEGQFVYVPTLRAIEEADPDVVVLLMDEDQQELFLTQAASSSRTWRVAPLPTIRSQTRAFLQRYLQVAPELATRPRLAVWDPALANDLNDAYASRNAAPMSGAAWTTYAGLMTLFEASGADVGHEPSSLVDFLVAAERSFDVAKDQPARYRASDRQLASTLYLVEPVEGATWGRTAEQQTAFARVVGTVDAATAWPDDGTASAGDCPGP